MEEMPLLGGSQGYVVGASGAFRTVSELQFSETGTVHVMKKLDSLCADRKRSQTCCPAFLVQGYLWPPVRFRPVHAPGAERVLLF